MGTPREEKCADYGGFNSSQASGHHKESTDHNALRKQSVMAMTKNVTGEIKNPLTGLSKEELMSDVEEFAKKNDMVDELPLLRKGALVAQNPTDFENLAELDGK